MFTYSRTDGDIKKVTRLFSRHHRRSSDHQGASLSAHDNHGALGEL